MLYYERNMSCDFIECVTVGMCCYLFCSVASGTNPSMYCVYIISKLCHCTRVSLWESIKTVFPSCSVPHKYNLIKPVIVVHRGLIGHLYVLKFSSSFMKYQ